MTNTPQITEEMKREVSTLIRKYMTSEWETNELTQQILGIINPPLKVEPYTQKLHVFRRGDTDLFFIQDNSRQLPNSSWHLVDSFYVKWSGKNTAEIIPQVTSVGSSETKVKGE